MTCIATYVRRNNPARFALLGMAFVVLWRAGFAAAGEDPAADLTMLRTPLIEVGVLTDVGGRIVLMRRPGEENVLLSDPSRWSEPESERPSPEILHTTPHFWKPYNGHVTWLSPQSEWYDHQDAFPRKKGHHWPPDPYLLTRPYSTIESSETHLILQSPDSPISGVRLTKRIEIAEDGTVRLTTAAKNIRDKAVAWSLWSNTRVPSTAAVYVPDIYSLKIETTTKNMPESQPFQYDFLDRFFALDRRLISFPAPYTRSSGKAFLRSEKSMIAAFIGKECLVKRFPYVESDKIHPEHAAIEIYCAVAKDKVNKNFIELENHGAYTQLQPGQSMSMKESFSLSKYRGESTHKDRIAFLQKLQRDENDSADVPLSSIPATRVLERKE